MKSTRVFLALVFAVSAYSAAYSAGTDRSQSGPEMGFWCEDGIGAKRGDKPKVVLEVLKGKRAIVACGREVEKRGSRVIMTEFDIWDTISRPRPLAGQETPPASLQEAISRAHRTSTRWKSRGSKGSRVDQAKPLRTVSAIDWAAIEVDSQKGKLTIDALTELPDHAGKLELRPYIRESLTCASDRPCKFSEATCALTGNISVLADQELRTYGAEIANSILFLDDANDLRLKQLLSSVLAGNHQAQRILEKLEKDPRRDGHLAQEIRRASAIVKAARQAGCFMVEE